MIRAARCSLLAIALALGSGPALGQTPALPLQPTERLHFDTSEVTWMALDVSPDGKTILFDLLGDIYALDIAGGTARPLLTGQAFETQPVFSPDGKRIAFISDRAGSNNLWVANADGNEARKLSNDTGPALYTSPAWSPDGRFVYVSQTVHSTLAFELYAYDVRGGTGVKVTNAKPTGTERGDDRINVLGAVASPDGEYLYYSRKAGSLWSERPLPHWEIVRRDLSTGAEDKIISAAPGAAMRPALSHDGTKLVYGARNGADTTLRLRDLTTGEDRLLTAPIDHDTQISGFYNDLVPRVAFLPGDKAILTAIDGKITRVTLADGARTPLPFTATVEMAIGKNTRVAVPDETGPVRVRIIQAPRLSPDGKQVAFAALGKLYVQVLAGDGRPVAVGGVEGMAFQPSWTPNGRALVYITWDAQAGGGLWSVPAGGGKPRKLTTTPAFYTEPVVSPDGRSVAVLRASQSERLNLLSEQGGALATDILTLPLGGGTPRVVTSATAARALDYDGEGKRLRFMAGSDIWSIAPDGVGRRKEASLTVLNGNRYFANLPVPPEHARLSPDGSRMLVKAASQLYLVDVPPVLAGEPQKMDLGHAPVAVAKVTAVGADYLDWSHDGKSVLWSVGSTLRTLPTDLAATSKAGSVEARATSVEAPVELPRDVPGGTVVLRGGTAITERGGEVIANADVVVTGNRIVAVGASGSVAVPAGAAIRDVSGQWIVPGFVDTHAHWFETRRQILDPSHWDFLANLAYGVTSGLEVQPFTIDVFGYQDMIDAGLMIGPRAYSTGPGVFSNAGINSLDDARNVLTRYRDHYRTRNIKAYMVGNRTQRQYMVMATAELGMMATTEGASDFNLNLSHALDGFAGNEHNMPITPLRKDVLTLYGQTRIGYSPTLDVLYGGTPPLSNFIIAGDLLNDAKLRHFIPRGILETRSRDRKWVPPIDQTWNRFAADALAIRHAGGLVGIGSHGTVQGLGCHFEMEAYATGGATPAEVLRAATIESAEQIGRAAYIGSLEPGKYADLLILSKDPLADVRNTRAISQVMKNGRIYDAGTLDEVYPRQRALPRQWFQEGK
ncbi:amidohydrolase family protein [Sphingomonadaceae bacterium jetA1]|jgi:Tol biopolymer transport system component|uniref:amidohydrolase family protein n=1 Tax=Facivitalis istanbulensis TaxID=3075838 RepID=UPI003487FC28